MRYQRWIVVRAGWLNGDVVNCQTGSIRKGVGGLSAWHDDRQGAARQQHWMPSNVAGPSGHVLFAD